MLSLVLSGGGARGAYQVGVLRRIAEMRPDLPFPVLVGSSVGSINVSYIGSRSDRFATAVDALAQLWATLTVDRIYRTDTLSLSRIGLQWLRELTGGGHLVGTRARSLLDTTPLQRLLAEHLHLRNIRPFIERGLLRAVTVIATSYTTGQSVSFVQGHSGISPWSRSRRVAVLTDLGTEHVLASCAIPFIFPAVRVGDAHYGDGNVRLSNPFSPAAKLGASRILAVSLRHPKNPAEASVPLFRGYPPLAQVAGVLMNSVFLDSFDDDVAQLVRVNSLLSRTSLELSGSEEEPGLRRIQLLVVAPSRDLGRLAGEHAHRFPPVVRWLLRGLGAGETQSADLVSYLLFDRSYTQPLLELGYADAAARTSAIERFLDEADP